MSSSPDRMSSYRRQFDRALMDVPAVHQLQLYSTSTTGQERQHRSASLTRRGRKGLSERSHQISSASAGALCYGSSTGLAPKLDLDVASVQNQAFLMTRTGERQEMMALNDRLAAYIEKVRTLESKNNMLEAEIESLKGQHVRPSGLRQLYECQLRDLNRASDQIRAQRDSSLAAKEAMLAQLDLLKTKYEETVEARKRAESEIDNLRPEVDKATSARLSLEKQLDNLEMELTFLQRVHKEEIEELLQKIYSATSKIDPSFDVPDLSSALGQIQAQYACIAAKNLQEMDTWYKAKFEDLSHASATRVHGVRGLREELGSYKKDILNKEQELDALKSGNAHLEILIRDSLEKYKKREDELQERIEALKLDLNVIKKKIALHLREYQDLLNIKMALEIEITTYRKLIEGEDHRLSTVVHSLTLAVYSESDSEKNPTTEAETIEEEADVKVEMDDNIQEARVKGELDETVPLEEEVKNQEEEKVEVGDDWEAASVGEDFAEDPSFPDNQTEEINHGDENSEMSESKTLLSRSVTSESAAQERSVNLPGLAEEQLMN
ncbi:notochord granular surface [Vanacampus margaritifer]